MDQTRILRAPTARRLRTLAFVRPAQDARISAIVESGADPERWEPVLEEPEVVATGTTHEPVRIRVPAMGDRRWWRVRTTYRAD